MLKEYGFEDEVELNITPNGLIITPAKKKTSHISEALTLSQKSLARDWDTPEEDVAWVNL